LNLIANPMSALPHVNITQHGTRSRIDVLHLVVVLILSALPAAAATAFPPDVLADKNQAFITLYLMTLPWSLAVSAIVAGFAGGWFGPDERKQVLAVAGILLVTAVLGGAIAPGSPLDEHFTGGPLWVVVSEAIVFGVIGYALMYGWPMWFASFFAAAYVGWWVHEKRVRADLADVASARLTLGSGDPAPSASGAGVAIAVDTPNLTPRMTNDVTFQRRPVGSATRPPDELAGLTKAELYQRARDAGIKGRSAMSKAQLLAALRADLGADRP
jgi:hypothetical protein